MSHWVYLGFIAGCLATLGCTGNKLAPEVQPGRTATEGSSVEAKTGGANSAAQHARQPSSAATDAPLSPASSSSAPQRELARRLIDGDSRGGWRVNEQAATELEKQGPDGVAQLWPLLSDPQVEIRRGAVFYLLGRFKPSEAPEVSAFVGLLADSDRTIRSFAVTAIKQFRREDQIAALPHLAAMLNPAKEDNADNRAAIARLCGGLKSDASASATALQAAATADPDAKVRAAALRATAQVVTPAAAVPTLAKGLKDGEAAVRLVAAAGLRQLGAAAAPVAGELAAALGDVDASVAEAAAEALLRIGKPAVTPLAEQLASESVAGRKLALACLAKLGPVARPAATAIEKYRQDSDPQVRQLAEVALKRIAGQ